MFLGCAVLKLFWCNPYAIGRVKVLSDEAGNSVHN